MAFYAALGGLRELIGVSQGEWLKYPGGTFAGFSREGRGLVFQPEFAPHAWWNANAFAPDPARAAGRVAAVWRDSGWLDFVCPMNYIDSTRAFQSVILMQKSLVGKAALYPGIGLSCWTDGSSYPLKLSRQITAVRAAGLKGFTVFNFDASAEHALPYVSLGVTRE